MSWEFCTKLCGINDGCAYRMILKSMLWESEVNICN